jgi:tetratricopeptide (TPR) repeat protein
MLKLKAAHAGGLLLLLTFLLSGCASLQSSRLSPDAYPGAVELTEVPFFPDEQYHCGPAALAAVLQWGGVPATPEQLVPQLYVPERRGTFQLELVANARRHGMIPYVLAPSFDALLLEVKAGHPVIVLQNLGLSWYAKWHYAVVVGFDLTRDEMVLRSGTERRHLLPLSTFERTWQRGDYWAVVVLPPTRLPTTAEELPYVQAVAALERLKRWDVTAQAYGEALSRWPRSLAAQLGYGNSRYALGNLGAAELAYRNTTRDHPDSADAWNNLGHVLAEQGRWGEAERAARKAVSLAGQRLPTYQKTLDDILARRIQLQKATTP